MIHLDIAFKKDTFAKYLIRLINPREHTNELMLSKIYDIVLCLFWKTYWSLINYQCEFKNYFKSSVAHTLSLFGVPLFWCKISQMKEAWPQPPILRQKKNCLLVDIVFDILARLPMKLLLRFRCVQKSWYFHITSPNFISTHLNMFLCLNQGYGIHMPTINLDNQDLKVACDRTFDGISEFKIPFSFQSGLAFLVGSCNGLLCFSDFRLQNSLINNAFFGFNAVYLWNPSIRKFKKLPDTCLSQLHLAKLGFAHHSQKNDYKVVRISRPFTKPMPPLEAEVYTLSSDS